MTRPRKSFATPPGVKVAYTKGFKTYRVFWYGALLAVLPDAAAVDAYLPGLCPMMAERLRDTLDRLRAAAPSEYAQLTMGVWPMPPAWVQDEGDSCEWYLSAEAKALYDAARETLADLDSLTA